MKIKKNIKSKVNPELDKYSGVSLFKNKKKRAESTIAKLNKQLVPA